MNNFKDKLGAKLNVGDIIVCGVRHGQSTAGVTLGRILELHPKGRYETRCYVTDDLNIKTKDELNQGPVRKWGFYRYCSRVYLLSALVIESKVVLERPTLSPAEFEKQFPCPEGIDYNDI